MSSILRTSTLLLTLLFTLTSSTPLPWKRQPNTTPLLPSPLERRAPVSASSFSDWATNVVMLGGSQQYGMWVPPDGNWYDLSSIQCLDLPAYAVGSCDSPTVDEIGVAVGNGPCSFVGSNGFSATLSGAAGSGYYTVGPPQTMQMAACGS